jgi:hypothetical protein
MQSLVFGALEMAVSVEKEPEKSSAPAVKKGGRGLSFEEKRKRLSEYLLQKVLVRCIFCDVLIV